MANIWDIQPSAWGGSTSSGGGFQPAMQPATAQPSSYGSWYNNSGYGQDRDWYNTEVSQNIREQNLPVAFSSWGARNGVADDGGNFSKWFQNQFGRFQRGYAQATMDNPMMNVDQFMATLPNAAQLRQEYMMQSAQARGDATSQYAPNVRWINR